MIEEFFFTRLNNVSYKMLSNLFLVSLIIVILELPALGSIASVNNLTLLEKTSEKSSKNKRTRREPPSDYSRSGGSRGCPGEAIPLTLLAPYTFVGKTTSVRPTFTWFISKGQPIELRLFETDTSKSTPKRFGFPVKRNSISGINQLSLPTNHPALTVGKKYIWQLSIECPTGSLVQRAEFRVVSKSPLLNKKLSNVTNNFQKAHIYAEHDLWYQALEEALKFVPQGKLGQLGSEIVQNLAKSDNFMTNKFTLDRREIFNKEIQQRINHLEKIAAGS